MEPTQPPLLTTTEPTSRNTLIVGGVWMIALAALLLMCGMCSTLFYVILPFTQSSRGDAVETNVAFGALAGFAILFGTAFLWQGIGTLIGRGLIQAARVFPHLLVLALLFFVSILLGLGALSIQTFVRGAQGSTIAAIAFPPWHVIAACMPPLAFLAYAAHRLGATSGARALFVSVGWGALGATALAVVAEILIALIFIIIAALVISLGPNSQSVIDQLRSQIQLAQQTRDYAAISEWLNDPSVLLGVLLYTAVLIPFVE